MGDDAEDVHWSCGIDFVDWTSGLERQMNDAFATVEAHLKTSSNHTHYKALEESG